MSLRIAAKAGECSPSLSDPELLPEIRHKAAKAAVLDQEQLQRYMAACAGSPCAVPLMLMACGLRRGEALGATWQALDQAEGTLAVIGQRLPGAADVAPLKTAASYRVLQLPLQLRVELARKPRPEGGGWLCDCSQHQLYQQHRRVLRHAQLPTITLHGLRHSFATAAVAKGVPIKVLQGALGHAKYQLTADLYADHLPSTTAVACKVFIA